mmetsp:Transcript_8139/g.17542  ORF Transcript_8139/g.17542 Transcript_8139/m.17542 type:complete len:431 (-) Transcript_8139:239-1531(-)
MFIKKDLRKIPTILDEAIDCNTYDDENDENDTDENENKLKKRSKREEPIRILKLGRRKQEFDGCVRVLCQPEHAPKLKYLSVLNLYECDIHDLNGLGPVFGEAAPNLETLNLGRNPLSKGIPDDFSEVRSLKHLWLDDCKLTGALPRAFLNLPKLESLRLPNNEITHLDIGGIDTNNNNNSNSNTTNIKKIDDGEEYEYGDSVMNDVTTTEVIPLKNLKLLCLDGNLLGSRGNRSVSSKRSRDKINGDDDDNDADDRDDGDDLHEKETGPTVLPSNLAEWAPDLEELLLRHNNFRKLGVQKWPPTLRVLHVSSNRLENLDEVVAVAGGLPSLTHLYANGNRLSRLPEGILDRHPKLQRLVVSHNPPLKDLPEEVWKKLGMLPSSPDDTTTTGEQDGRDSSCEILWQPNPNLSAPGDDSDSGSAEDTAMQG